MEQDNNKRELDDFLSDLHRLLDDVETVSEPGGVARTQNEYDLNQLLEDAETPDAEEEDIDVDSLLARAEAAEAEVPEEPAAPEPETEAEAAEEAEEAEAPEAEEVPEAESEAEPEDTEESEEPESDEEPEAEAETEEESEEAEEEAEEESESEAEEEAEAPKKSKKEQKFEELVSWTQRQRVPRHVAKLQKNQEQAYAEWLEAQDQLGDQVPPPEVLDQMPDEALLPPRKKHHYFRNFLIVLVVLALAMAASAVFLLPKQPNGRVNLKEEPRREGVSTVLILGTDASGARTDAMVLLTVDEPAGKLSLVSIPRDTLVSGSYEVPKLNSVYAANGGGNEGIEMVEIRVSQCIGYMPDAYMLVNLENFADLVDLLGGVEFDVPMDMVYEDPAQNLKIHLKAGKKVLDGEDAVALMRFRSGYPDADLGRIQVQRQFLTAMLNQALKPGTVLRLPQILDLLLRDVHTDLSAGNLLWLARAALNADLSDIQSATLPGSPAAIGDGSYYVLDPASVAQTVNGYCNPFAREMTPEDLEIRQG